MKILSVVATVGLLLSMALPLAVSAQQLTASTSKRVDIVKGASAQSLKRKLKDELELGAVRSLLKDAFAVKMTPQVEAKLPDLVQLLSSSIEISMDPSDGETLSGKASITIASAKLKEYLTNNGIGAGDVAAASARILVSIDEYIGVATTNDGRTATTTSIAYSHDKSAFSDTSSKSSGAQSSSSSAAKMNNNDVAYANKESLAVSGRQAASVSASQSTSVAGRQESGVAYQGIDGSAAAGSRSQYSGSSNGRASAAQSSQFAAAGSSQTGYSDKSASSSSNSAASASRSSAEQKNVQQQNDKVSFTVETKMPEFGNAKAMGSSGVLASRLSGEFLNAGLKLVSENDLRAEGGRILPVSEITNNGRTDQFVSLIQKKGLEADVWATGQANYTIVGTTPTGTQCNGNLSVKARFIEGNQVFFEDAIQAAAMGNGDQDCQAKLGIALASSLAKTLGERANKTLQARSSRGGVYTLYLYSASSLKRPDRRKFQEALEKLDGLTMSEPLTKEFYMAVTVQYAGALKSRIDSLLDKMDWDKAEILSKGDKICVGIEGMGACPAEFR